MGPGDPFAPRPAAPGRARPEVEVSADVAPDSEPPVQPPVRVQARPPEAPRSRGLLGNAVVVGAVAGLVLGGLGVTLGVGRTAVVVVCTLLGAALGALLKNAFSDGIDVGAAWRALRRR